MRTRDSTSTSPRARWSSASSSCPSSPPLRYSKHLLAAGAPRGAPQLGERFGTVLSRTCSSMSSTQRYKPSSYDRGQDGDAPQGGGGALRRAFSLRKSSSTTDGYWRMSDIMRDDEEADGGKEEQEKGEARVSGKKRAKILRACRKLLGIKSHQKPSSAL